MATVVKTYALDLDRNGTLRGICGREVDSMMTQSDAGAELDRRVRRYAADHGQDLRTHYSDILHKILEGASQDLKAAYAGVSSVGQAHTEGEAATPADEVDRRVRVYMREKGETDYSVALHAVLEADPELRDAYAW